MNNNIIHNNYVPMFRLDKPQSLARLAVNLSKRATLVKNEPICNYHIVVDAKVV